LAKLSDYQQKWGKAVVPAKSKVDLEVFMNKVNINFKLLIFYTIIGGLLLILGFVELFKPKKVLNKAIKAIIVIGIVGYLFHFLVWWQDGIFQDTLLGVTDMKPLSFISWVGITAGLLLYRNSNALIPAAGFMVAVIMMGFAHGGSALDPQITPLFRY
jgi:hypothetical protein